MTAADPHARSLMGKTDFSRRAFVAAGLGSGFALAVLPVSAETITTDAGGLTAGDVEIPVEGGRMPAYRAMPAKSGRFATVLVVQEVFGVHEHIKGICRRFAKLGYFAVAPYLYWRFGDVTKLSETSEVVKFANRASEPQVMSDLDATIAWAKSTKKANTSRTGITGFCRGGRYVWLYAEHNPHLKAAVAWYGPLAMAKSELTPVNPPDQIAELKVPVLGLYGAADQGIPVAEVEKFRDALKAAGKKCDFVIYQDTPHGFFADYRPSYRPDAAADGWRRLQAWFKSHGVA
ncbi:MAG TPA: dienelactone hydrolase family protein [Alphaproteobacteria bacterium]|nr:dienelactone hydrolase family protein [Alphaproteobacteria bacterium]